MPSWHPPDSDSGSVQDDESIIKVHNDAKTRFGWIWPFGIWTKKNTFNRIQRISIHRIVAIYFIIADDTKMHFVDKSTVKGLRRLLRALRQAGCTCDSST